MSLNSWPRQRKLLFQWVWWAPVLAVVFGLLIGDAWLNNETRNNDYKFTGLRSRIRKLEARLRDISATKAELQTMNRLSRQAQRLGMVKPDPNDIATIRYDAAEWSPIIVEPAMLAGTDIWSLFEDEQLGEIAQAPMPEGEADTTVSAEGETSSGEEGGEDGESAPPELLQAATPVRVAVAREPAEDTVSAVLTEGGSPSRPAEEAAGPEPADTHGDDEGEEAGREHREKAPAGAPGRMVLDIPEAPVEAPELLDASATAMLGDFGEYTDHGRGEEAP